ncbi:hypothetical protein [Microbacterium sp. W4I20]|uniref:hypothetical protein n=1 Tax=Microbacterium sp. W4I20 TaxID=3042262 RepID=UPI0027861289|nr:hypothetical protein [Microbacterium sp. W4I20]MDQ0729080.1 hypothetical protein [Microbacterium sp. W4I20]
MKTPRSSTAVGAQAIIAVVTAVIAYFVLSLASQFSRVATVPPDAIFGVVVCVIVALGTISFAPKFPFFVAVMGAALLVLAAVALVIGWNSFFNNLPSPVDFVSIYLFGGASPVIWIAGGASLLVARPYLKVART